MHGMKNEIELKEELLVLEAEYNDIFNRSQSNGCKYWYDKEKQYKARELSNSISKCKKELDILLSAKKLQDEIATLKAMKHQMEISMKDADVLPSSFKKRLEKLNNDLQCLEGIFDQNFSNK